jgi:hypothetical protein
MIERGKVIRSSHITREMVRADRNTIFVFGDNMVRRGLGGQAQEMRGEPNTIGVPTKWTPHREMRAYFTDKDFPRVMDDIQAAFDLMAEALHAGRNVVIPADGLGTGLADLTRRASIKPSWIGSLCWNVWCSSNDRWRCLHWSDYHTAPLLRREPVIDRVFVRFPSILLYIRAP